MGIRPFPSSDLKPAGVFFTIIMWHPSFPVTLSITPMGMEIYKKV